LIVHAASKDNSILIEKKVEIITGRILSVKEDNLAKLVWKRKMQMIISVLITTIRV